MNVFTHPFNSFVSRRFFFGINYMQAASPAIRAWGIQKKKHTVTGPSPPQNKGAGYLCGYLYARGSGKAATPQDSWESERSEYLGKALKLKECRGVFRGSMGEMAYLPIYLYLFIPYPSNSLCFMVGSRNSLCFEPPPLHPKMFFFCFQSQLIMSYQRIAPCRSLG